MNIGSQPTGGGSSIASRLRWAFLLVIVATTVVAAITTVVLVRRTNERETRDEVQNLATVAATEVAAQVEGQLDSNGRDVGRVAALVPLLQRSLSIQNAEIVRVSDAGIATVRGDQFDSEERLPSTRVAVSTLNGLLQANGTTFVVSNDNAALAVAPIPLSVADTRLLGLGDDIVVVVAARELGPAGLGSAGTALLVAAVVAVLVALLLAEVLARRIRRPLSAVASTTRAISTGDLAARVELPAGADREVTDVARTVDEMASRLSDAQRERQQFLVDVSHEFRTPLTSIAGYAELLNDGLLTDESGIKEAGEVVGREAARLRRLTDDLLAQARLDAGEMTVSMEQIDLATVIDEVVAASTPEAKRLSIKLISRASPTPVLADRTRLHQVIGNLIDNAVSFASTEVEITAEQDAGSAVLIVSDDGPGLGSYADRVFDRSFTTNRSSDRRGNLGVGLTVVAQLVEAMNGTVIAADGQSGARFTVRLPVSQATPT